MVNIKRLPLPLMEMYEWQYDGMCMDMDSEVFFSPEAERGAKRVRREDAAKALCRRAPSSSDAASTRCGRRSRTECGAGLSESERAELVGRQSIAS